MFVTAIGSFLLFSWATSMTMDFCIWVQYAKTLFLAPQDVNTLETTNSNSGAMDVERVLSFELVQHGAAPEPYRTEKRK